jgi:hypothetical protein
MADRIHAAANAAEPGRKRVAVFGEFVQLLWEQGHREATIALERLWNQEVLGRHNGEVLCGYSADAFQSGVDNQFIEKIHAEHTAVHSWLQVCGRAALLACCTLRDVLCFQWHASVDGRTILGLRFD